ncbi:MAG: carbon starvation protein A, partial [Sporichthyaceae bacterium]|nr:carbon starvation protein A [Sporichthyaceae bacterium]
ASVIDQGLYFAMNSPAGATGGEPGTAAEFVRTLGFTITPADLSGAAQSIQEESLISRTGGAPTLAFGISLIFTEAFGGGLAAFWYHFAIMFEALFILTAVDAGTRVGRFMLQDTIGNVWPRYADMSWKPASWSASAVVVGLWGYMLYVGVTDPLGGINQLFPLFGISNQLLAAIALTLCVTLMFKHGKAKWAWVPGIALAWDLTTTMTASWQKVFSSDPRIGYFEQRSAFQAALDKGDLLPPATDVNQMQQVITNSTVNGVLQALFALLTLTVVLSAIPIWIKAFKSGGLPTTEFPHEPSRIVAPSDFFATKHEKEAVREYEASQRELVGSGGRR